MVVIANRKNRSRRTGSMSFWLVLLVPVMLAGILLAVNSSRMRTSQEELRTGTEASALAATRTLADERLLVADGRYLPVVLDEARGQSMLIAANHSVAGRPLQLEANTANDPEGDLLFGHLAAPWSKQFGCLEAAQITATPNPWMVNAVRVQGRCMRARGSAIPLLHPLGGSQGGQAAIGATAMLDRHILGFQTTGSQPVPLAPLALLSDPTASIAGTWETQLAHPVDLYTYDPRAKVYGSGSDGLPEVRVQIGGTTDNASVICLGAGSGSDLAVQMDRGILPAQLRTVPGGNFVIDATGVLNVTAWSSAVSDGPTVLALREALLAVQQRSEARIWPLWSVPGVGTQIGVSGFVAARVVRVEPAGTAGAALSFWLQPTVVVCSRVLTARTEAERTRVQPNPYLCRLRLVE